ncbi:sigma-70 family RNA polymerase sigma factor [Rhizobium alvei]|uniref:Sigma-70 family RNA polymerase sigma factor n=1 Tax=Rhizobium alvei TaxID=1132659 RepID=A0ABT8YN95_9HYPH|nr:sigma-70 family RNA polymerase sigma factor [Rhizobium alvei]MDO6965203.1 sigma-70 family RNA polymerase sigma factor [Rhizobium alvei]
MNAPVTTTDTPFDFKRAMIACLPNLRAFAVSLTGRADRADDLVQDCVLKAWAAKGSFDPGSNIKAWLFTILRNEFFSQMRKAGREVQDSDGFFTGQAAVIPEQDGVADLKDLKNALDQLPADQREAIILVGASGFSYEEAAEICGCAIGTIKSRVNRARQRLAELLGVEDEGDFAPSGTIAAVTRRSFPVA